MKSNTILTAISTHIRLQSRLIFFLFSLWNNIVAKLSLYYNTLVRDLQERKKWRRISQSPVTAVVLLFVVAFLVRSDYNIYRKNQVSKISREDSDKKLLILQERHNRLSAELDKLKTERGVEEELRSKFQITKGGEEVLVVVDDTPDKGSSSNADKSYWQRFREFFGF